MTHARLFAFLLSLGFAALVSAGCAGTSTQALGKRDMAALAPIKVVRHETPGIMKSTKTETGILALATIAAPGGSALLFVGDAYSQARGSGTQAFIPDFGSLVMDMFVEEVSAVRSDWPAMTVVPEPLKEETPERSTVIEFNVNRLAYGSIDLTRGGIILEQGFEKGFVADGFLSKTTVTMKDPEGDVLWQKSYIYLSKDFDREKTLDELEADDYVQLRQEMTFAAQKTVADFVRHLNGSAN
ncbi:MAG: hypothetical protein OHK006_22780 [Thermodesulfovibrionales bacterium]